MTIERQDLTSDSPLTARIRTTRLDARRPLAAVLGGLLRQPQPAVLESSARHESFGRYSILACRPIETVTVAGGRMTDSAGRILARGEGGDVWPALAAMVQAIRIDSAGGTYGPGWIGYIGYEMGRHVERLRGRAVRDTHLSDLRLSLYDAVLVHDCDDDSWRLSEMAFDDPPPQAGLAAAALREVLGAAGGQEAPHAGHDRATPGAGPEAEAESNFTPEGYRRAVARCVEYIAAGDIFQVNLSQRFRIAEAPGPEAIYAALRRRNPAWYSAYLGFEGQGRPCAVVSSSPELFLRVRGGRVVTRPIKGTRPRTGEAAADAAAAADLLASPKDNAELAMIIDLLRNDLGRVCRYGSVRVTEACRLETHPTVYHLVGTVEGVLRDGVGAIDLLRATFPGGSITGAPKIRAMDIIDELEGVARGVYTGCIGWLGLNGDCEWNIAIRTVVCDGPLVYVQVGGGIVADSQPQAEYQETLDKARALLEAIAQAKDEDRKP